MPRVAVVVAPWASTTRPSLAAGIIHALAEQAGAECRSHYANIAFSSVFGPEAFEAVAGDTTLFPLGEHLFAADIFGREALGSDDFLLRYVRSGAPGGYQRVSFGWDTLSALRDYIVPAWLDEWTERLLDDRAEVIGFSCVFNQVLPSLALARRLKEAKPGLVTLLGGACVHGAMGREYASAFRGIIDHVFTGEADSAFPAWLAERENGASASVPGVTARGVEAGAPLAVNNLDDTPTPAYGDYFAMREQQLAMGRPVASVGVLPFESSRGCWWGAKQHCVFCGLNNEGIVFRRKSVGRVVAEVTELLDRHGHRHFAAADNILPHDGYTNLLPALAAMGRDATYFYEIKANVRRDDVAMLRAAGVDEVQPGIESFSDAVLKEMRKGVTGVQNVALLKWLAEFGVRVSFNMLIGFPGETDADYEEMIAVLPRLAHLPAPMFGKAITVEVHRFSPYFDASEEMGIRGVRPASFYQHLIPPSVADLSRVAYFFEHDVAGDAPLHRHRGPLDAALLAWGMSRRRMAAELLPGAVCIHVSDGEARREVTLDGLASLVFLLCDAATSPSRVEGQVQALVSGAGTDVARVLDELVDQGFVVRIGGRVVGCVPMVRPHSSAEIEAWIDEQRFSPALSN